MSRFVALDGPDGCGKSTVARRVVAELRDRGLDVVHLREPGSTTFGEGIRTALLDPRSGDVDALAEALAFSAARRAMLTLEVAPALARGAVVVAERSFLSTVVYQCRAPLEPAPEDVVRKVTQAVHRGVPHDLVVLLDVDPDTAAARIAAGDAPDRIEARDRAFHERVRRGFLQLADERSWVRDVLADAGDGHEPLVVLDATAPLDDVVAGVVRAFDGVCRR